MALTVPGSVWRSSFQSTVDGILNPMGIHVPVKSCGDKFFNRDRWTGAHFAEQFRNSLRTGAKITSTGTELQIQTANQMPWSGHPSITIANTPDVLPGKTALALNGGAAHEAWHTVFSQRDPLQFSKVWAELQPRLEQKIPWHEYADLMHEAGRFFEDVRIEALGLGRWPSFMGSMKQLQDFTLEQEGVLSQNDSVFLSSMRDIGFQYDTDLTNQRLEERRQSHPEVLRLIDTRPIRDLLEQLRLDRNPMAFLYRGMDLCIELQKLRSKHPVIESLLEKFQDERSQPESMSGTSAMEEHLSPLQSQDYRPFSTDDDKINIAPLGEEASPPPKPKLSNWKPPWKKNIPEPPPPDEASKAVVTVISNLDGSPVKQPNPNRTDDGDVDLDEEDDDIEEEKEEVDLKTETRYLTTKLRVLLRTASQTHVRHGVKKGRHLSSRYLAESGIALRSREEPQRAFTIRSRKIDFTVAAVVSRDLSGSTSTISKELDMCTQLLIEALDAARAKVLAFGWTGGSSETIPGYHRSHGVEYDVWKDFHEPAGFAKSRMPHSRARGTTPMVDGMCFSLNALRARKENMKVLFMITDGYPNRGTEAYLKLQLERARKENVHVLGVGIGSACSEVSRLFPNAVYCATISQAPAALVQQLTQILKP